MSQICSLSSCAAGELKKRFDLGGVFGSVPGVHLNS